MDMTTFRSLALAGRVLENTPMHEDQSAMMMVAAMLRPLVKRGIDEATLMKLLMTDVS